MTYLKPFLLLCPSVLFSMTPQEAAKNSSWDRVAQFAHITQAGFLGTAAKHVIYQPLAIVKSHQQAFPGSEGMFSLAHRIYRERGFVHGLYAGGVPGFTRAFLAQIVRMPAKIYLPPFVNDQISSHLGVSYTYLTNPIVSVITAAADAAILTPLERVKTMMMTREKETTTIKNQLVSEHSGVRALYRGASTTIIRDTVLVMTYLSCNDYIRSFWLANRESKDLKIHETFLSSFLVGGMMTLTGAPFDLIKTLRQSFHHDPAVDRIETLIPFLREHVQKHGVRYLWAGYGPRYTQSVITAFWNIYIMDYFWGKIRDEDKI